MNINKIKRGIETHSIISFDIFDTLLKRHVRNPQDVFDIVEREYNKETRIPISTFRKQRIEAEKKARKNSSKEDVLLDEIYTFLPYDIETRKRLKDLELHVEETLLTANTAIRPLFDYACSLGKDILIISDMYLPEDFIKKLLIRNGYEGYKKLYVSSTVGFVKSTGNLFKYIFNDFSCNPNQMFHIGDAKRSDWIVPRSLGMTSYLLNRYDNHMLYGDDQNANNLDFSVLYSFINNTVQDIKGHYEQIGYETLGPLLHGFCIWLHAYKDKLGLKRLLFFSRDGQIICRAYKQLFPNDLAEYVYMSRRSLTVPLIHKQSCLAEILEVIPINWYTEVQVLLDRLGLDYDDYSDLVETCGLQRNTLLTKNEYLTDARFLKLYSKLEKNIRDNSKNEYDALRQYIESLQLGQLEGIVDIGWRGTIQLSLERLLAELQINVSLIGFYLGCSMQRDNAYGYVFSMKDSTLRLALLSFTGFFEALFSANHGSLKRYKLNDSFDFYQFEYDLSPQSKDDYKLLCAIQDGAMEFISNMACNPVNKYIHWNKSLVFYAMKKLGTAPSHKDLRRLGDLCFFDNKMMLLAHPKFFTLKQLKKDFAASTWKIAYLRRLLRLPLPYLRIYGWLRKRVNR